MVWGIASIGKLAVMRYFGEEVAAVVVSVPGTCDRYNFIKVSVDKSIYDMTISKKEYREGAYKIGQQIQLLRYKDYGELVWPGSRPELVILLIVGVLVLGYYTNRSRIKKSRIK